MEGYARKIGAISLLPQWCRHPETRPSQFAILKRGPLAELFGGAPALLLGIEDPRTNAHAPNESLDAGDFRKLTASLALFFDEVGKLPDGRVKLPEEKAAPA